MTNRINPKKGNLHRISVFLELQIFPFYICRYIYFPAFFMTRQKNFDGKKQDSQNLLLFSIALQQHFFSTKKGRLFFAFDDPIFNALIRAKEKKS